MAGNTNVKTKKRKSATNSELAVSTLILLDVVSLFLSIMPSVVAFSLTGLFIYYGFRFTWVVLPLAPFVLLGIFILLIALIRLSLPRLKPGRYKRGMNKATIAWFCHFALTRAAKLAGLIMVLQSLNVTRYLYWRALGVKASFQMMCSADVDFVDCPLITLGKNVIIGSQTCISCHSDAGSFLLLTPVTIEDDVFIGTDNIIGPGTTIKKGAWIGYKNSFINEVIEENTRIVTNRNPLDKEE